jgi:hypothetical protein
MNPLAMRNQSSHNSMLYSSYRNIVPVKKGTIYNPLLITDVAEKHLIIATKFTNFQLGQHCVIEPR